MIIIDFPPGAHGHFLSYVVNQYIFDIGVPIDNLFQTSGAAHFINTNKEFLSKRIVLHGHYSYFDYPYPSDTSQIIKIKYDPDFDFLLLINIYHRCHPTAVKATDVNIEDIKKLHVDSMFLNDHNTKTMRDNWYAKLMENHLNGYSVSRSTDLPVFDFNFQSFFTLENFIEELSLCADFCKMKLNFNENLVILHQKFLEINQGYHKWIHGKRIIDSVLTKQNLPISADDWQLQSYINYRISRIFKIHDGPLFDSDSYPGTTIEIHEVISNFIKNYDERF